MQTCHFVEENTSPFWELTTRKELSKAEALQITEEARDREEAESQSQRLDP